jgi:multidrug efflux pump
MINQVTDRVERKLEELGTLDYTNSYTSPGQTTVFVNLNESVRGPEIRATWISVRNKIADIQAELPSGVQGPFFNDQFGDVYGISMRSPPTAFRFVSCATTPNRRALTS